MRPFLIPVLVATGCASGGSALGGDASNQPPIDAKDIDAPMQHPDARPDAFVPDAFVPDAFVPDAFVAPDAAPDAGCTPVTTQLLLNPSFDLTPTGTNWVQTPIDASYPPITDQDGPPEQSAPYKVWLGGFEAADFGQTVTDIVYQDVTIPANTTQLTLTGYYLVGTMETSTTSVYDTGTLSLTQTNGTTIANVLSFTNLTTFAAWTSFNYTFPQNLSGQTVRLRMTSSNDYSLVTNFFFDSFALNATHCP